MVVFPFMENQNFTEGKIVKQLITFVFPIMFAMLLQSLYGAVDLLIVGHFSNAENLSGVTIGSMVMQTVTFVICDLAIGTTILLGQFIGQGEKEKCGDVIGATIVLFLIIGAIAASALVMFAPLLAAALNTPAESLAETVHYIRICGGGTVFIVAYNILGGVFRGIGNSKMPLITVAIASVVNVFADLFFVAVLGMGSAGAAIATVLAQALSVVISFFIIRKQSLPFTFSKSQIRFNTYYVARIIKLGLPIALQDLLVSMSFLIIMALVNRLGVIASAGIGVAEKLCAFIMLVPSAFSQAMSSFVAQNYGAGKMERALRALCSGILISLGCGFVLGYLAFFRGVGLSLIFSKDMDVCRASADYLKGYGIDCLFTAFLFCFIGFFNGCSRTTFVMMQGIIGAFGVRVPLSMLFSSIEPVSIFRIALATPSSTFVQILLCLVYLAVFMRKRKGAEFARKAQ